MADEKKTVVKPKTVAKPQTGAKSKTVAKPQTEAKPKADAKPKTVVKPKAEAKSKAEAKPKADAKSKADAKPKPKAEAKPKGEAKPKPKAEAKPKGEAKPKPKAEAKPKGEAKPKPKAEAKPKGEAKPKKKGEPEDELEIIEEEEEDEKKRVRKPVKKIKPVLDDETRRVFELRNAQSKKRPAFHRQEWFRYKRLGDSYRKPRGLHSKMRVGLKYRPPVAKIGFRGPKAARGLHPSGFEEVLVHNDKGLEDLDPKRQAIRIAHGVGGRKRNVIQDKADDLGIRVLNRW